MGQAVLLFCSSRPDVVCALDAWSDFTSSGPAGRQDHSMVWDPETESALVYGGHAANVFLYFDDLWRLHWPSRSWTQISWQGPGARFGHSAVWDASSRSMLVLGGRHLTAYVDMWQFWVETGLWEPRASAPGPRAYHSAVFDTNSRIMFAFGGEDGEMLGDLHRYSLSVDAWMTPAAAGLPRSKHTAVWDSITRSMIVYAGWDGRR